MPIGWVIVGGMLFGTLLTLFVVPTAYTLLAGATSARRSRRSARCAAACADIAQPEARPTDAGRSCDVPRTRESAPHGSRRRPAKEGAQAGSASAAVALMLGMRYQRSGALPCRGRSGTVRTCPPPRMPGDCNLRREGPKAAGIHAGLRRLTTSTTDREPRRAPKSSSKRCDRGCADGQAITAVARFAIESSPRDGTLADRPSY